MSVATDKKKTGLTEMNTMFSRLVKRRFSLADSSWAAHTELVSNPGSFSNRPAYVNSQCLLAFLTLVSQPVVYCTGCARNSAGCKVLNDLVKLTNTSCDAPGHGSCSWEISIVIRLRLTDKLKEADCVVTLSGLRSAFVYVWVPEDVEDMAMSCMRSVRWT